MKMFSGNFKIVMCAVLLLTISTTLINADGNCTLLNVANINNTNVVYMAVFSGISQLNPTCGLGDSGQTMIVAQLLERSETKYCRKSNMLSIFGSNVYYSLKLSDDGSSIDEIRMQCNEDCKKCAYIERASSFESCRMIQNQASTFSVQFTKSDDCYGPHTLSGHGITVYQYFTPKLLLSDGTTGLLAMSINENDLKRCHEAYIFGLRAFSYIPHYDATSNAYSLQFCNSTFNCSNPDLQMCETVFNSLPVNECRSNKVSIFGSGEVLIHETSQIQVCPQPKPASSEFYYVMGGMVGVVVVIAIAIFVRQNLRLRENYHELSSPS